MEKKYSKILQKENVWYFPGMSWKEYYHLNHRYVDNLKRKNNLLISVSEYRKNNL